MAEFQQELLRIADLIRERIGIVYAGENLFQLRIRVDELARTHCCSNPAELLKLLESPAGWQAREALFDASTNNETFFFRDRKLFDAIRDTVAPELAARRRPVRIWSSACSTGQEPYSLSILFSDMGLRPGADYVILASDVSKRALDRACLARYSELEMQRGLHPAERSRHFEHDGDAWVPRRSVRQPVRFSCLNLLEDFSAIGTFDLILCRNVLIYQTPESKARIVSRLRSRVESGGYLVLGSAESLLGIDAGFEQKVIGGVILYKAREG